MLATAWSRSSSSLAVVVSMGSAMGSSSGRLRRKLPPFPDRLALLREGGDPLPEVVRSEAGFAQLDQLALLLWSEAGEGVQHVDGVLVAAHREGCIRRNLGGQLDRRGLDLRVVDDLVHQAELLGPLRRVVPPGQEELLGARHTDRVDEPL